MKTPLKCLFVLFSLICLCHSCKSLKKGVERNFDLQYIEQIKPGLQPKIFAPGFISKTNESEFGSVFSKNGFEFYYGVDVNGKSEIRYTKLNNGKWTVPETILSHEKYGFNDPFLSPDETELYFISNKPTSETDTLQNINIWFCKKEKTGWSEPINAGTNINSNRNEYYISFAADGTLFFASNKNAEEKRVKYNFDIYSSKRINGQYQKAEILSDSINTIRYEADVFIAPDESYIIFCSMRKSGLGKGDLFISFKDEKGVWSKAKNMGSIINSSEHELCPFVSHDGQYFFYTSNQDIYWVRTEIFLNEK